MHDTLTEIAWNRHAAMPLLSMLQTLPLLGAAALLAFRERSWAEQLGRAFFIAELVLAVLLYAGIDANSSALQFAERFNLVLYHVGADGVTAL